MISQRKTAFPRGKMRFVSVTIATIGLAAALAITTKVVLGERFLERHFVNHPEVLHVTLAGTFARAVPLLGAEVQMDRTIDRFNHVQEGDILRLLGETIAAGNPLERDQHAGAGEILE